MYVLLISLFFVANLWAQPYDLTINITMGPHPGQPFKLRVVDQETNTEVAREVVASIDASTKIDITFTGILAAGKSYNVDFYVDVDASGGYTFPGDHSWREPLASVSENQTLTWSHNLNFVDIEFPAEQMGIKLLGKNIPLQLKLEAGKLYVSTYIASDLKVVWVSIDGKIKSIQKFKLDGKTNVSLPVPTNAHIGNIYLNGKLSGVARVR